MLFRSSVQAKDAIGRTWQMSTIQYDFNQPERFELDDLGPSAPPARAPNRERQRADPGGARQRATLRERERAASANEKSGHPRVVRFSCFLARGLAAHLRSARSPAEARPGRLYGPPFFSSVSTSLATALSVSNTPTPVRATPSKSGTLAGLSSSRSSSTVAISGRSRLLYCMT